MAQRRDRDDSGHPMFWLLLGFLCGVMATLGALLLLSGEVTSDGETLNPPVDAAPIEAPALDGAPPPGGPAVITPPPSVEAQRPVQEPITRPTLPTLPPPAAPMPAPAPKASTPAPKAAAPAPKATAPAPKTATRPPPSRSSADQMAEDAAASGSTARTR